MDLASIRKLPLLGAVAALAALAAFLPGGATASRPTTDTYFICPSVSVNSPNGMWVIGHHGGYFVNIPTQGATGSKVYLTVPVAVASTAQIPAGWALYNSLPSYPNFVGMAGLLTEGIDTWLTPYVISGSTNGWVEGNTVMVTDDGGSTYTVHNISRNSDIVIDHAIPLASAAVW
jgi:hypothetical protein